MNTLTAPPVTPRRSTNRPDMPPLENGDRLSLGEFLRRYEAMPELENAQLIEGVVAMPSPVLAEHATSQGRLVGCLVVYEAHTPGVELGDNGTTRLDARNALQPDGYLRILAECGGQSRIECGYVTGAPELVAEVSASTVSVDLHDKLVAYERNGVREYVVWRVWDGALDWFALRDGKFARSDPGADGIHRSAVFPGFHLDAPALLAGDMAKVLNTLQAGLASAEHAAFVAELARRRTA